MGKDYAQRDGGGRQARGRGALPGWLWLLVGIAIGVGAAAAWYLSRPMAPAPAVAATGERPSANGRKTVQIPPKEKPRFTFYELLPKYEVVVPKETLRPAPKAAAPADPGRPTGSEAQGDPYYIQVGAFRERDEAEQQKANLALLGIRADIETVTIDNRHNWFRVRIGPERGDARVQSILARLDENQIDALVVRVRD